jgi:hypothetical protein
MSEIFENGVRASELYTDYARHGRDMTRHAGTIFEIFENAVR